MPRPQAVLFVLFVVLGTLAAVAVATPSSASDADVVEMLRDADAWIHPPRHLGGLEAYPNAALSPRNDRWDVDLSKKPGAGCERGSAYLVSDLCAMGHLTKDAAMMASWLADHTDVEDATVADDDETATADGGKAGVVERRGDPRRQPPLTHVVFANRCMTRVLEGSAKIDKRAPLFHSVLQHWFGLVLSAGTVNDTLAAARLGGQGMTLEGLTANVEGTPSKLFEKRPRFRESGHSAAPPVKVLFTDDLERMKETAKKAGGTVCFESVIKRGPERWRWFRTRSHAVAFRARMWDYFGITPEGYAAATGRRRPVGDADGAHEGGHACILRVTVLERDEDRHFGEARVVKMLQERFADVNRLHGGSLVAHSLGDTRRCRVIVAAQKFDRLKGSSQKPPPHPEQLRILAQDTDVLVAAHGAGLASIVAMRPGTTVIELFPHNFRYMMYQELAELSGVRYVPYESPVVHPPKCCSARGGDALPALKKPHDGNGVGARACKKCDIFLTDDELFTLVADALAKTAHAIQPPASRLSGDNSNVNIL